MATNPLFAPLTLAHGPVVPNRLFLAPLTNQQSFADGRLSDAELRWLAMRAQGGFGLTMTCASHVQEVGQGFPGQLGIWSDDHVEGLARVAAAIRAAGSVSSVQLHHAGIRSPRELVGQPVGPSDDAETGARALSLGEVEELVAAFVAAAQRAEQAGFDGVEIHGAHGYVLTAFLSPETNRRTDRYGGSLENRARLLFEVVEAVRRETRPDFQVGLRLSPERFGLRLGEVVDVARELLAQARIDYLDMSLWDVAKEPAEEAYQGRSLMSHFTELPRGDVRLGVAGKVRSGGQAREALAAGADFVSIGRAAILHHDFPERVRADADFEPVELPVTPAYLHGEGLSEPFVDYMRGWRGFVDDTAEDLAS
jgi:2,4-dienoyl-CoA reductase-like NADH-dependent reductase (Old Yellow Enzyme family)